MFQAKNPGVRDRQLKVQKLSIPFNITHHATPASKTVRVDEPSILFLQCEGVDHITEAAGAVDDDTTLPTMSSESDSSGIFYAAVRIGEPVKKVISAKMVDRASAQIVACTILTSADSGNVIVVKVDGTTDLSSTDLDATLEVEYIIDEQA